jgi:uncharacterized protein YjbI with pentapeptide repeats
MDNDEQGVIRLKRRLRWNKWVDRAGFRGKTPWDWMSLLIVPLVIALAGWWLSQVSTRNQQQIEDRRAQAQQQIEDDRVRESVLQSYIQDMTRLLLDKGLATSKQDQPVRSIARSSTLAAVRQLDADRKGILLQFLYESNLIGTDIVPPDSEAAIDLGSEPAIDPIIYLFGADLSSANLSDANLSHAFLLGANLRGADLSRVFLNDANLSGADLSGADLGGADLGGADLGGADLSRTDLRAANLSRTDLLGANLSGADLSRANLWRADLLGADLSRAKGWTYEQLTQAEYLVGATLPDGKVMTEKAWEEFKKRYRK